MIYKKIVVKVGSNVLSQNGGGLNRDQLSKLVDQLAILRKNGTEAILVSSGAVASGKSMVQLPEKMDLVSSRQVWASVGQVKLLQSYDSFFERHNLVCAQVLVTREDFRDRQHYLNMRNCLSALLQNNIIPVVNENDVVSVTELMFTDNDELSALIATMLAAEALIILTNVDGVYDGPPSHPDSALITKVLPGKSDLSKYIQATHSQFGRGGMVTKTNMARKVAASGIEVHIANGKKENILLNILQGEPEGTHFVASGQLNGTRNWIAYSDGFAKGTIQLNEGAAKALLSDKAVSILPVGITLCEGEFETGDIIRIFDHTGKMIGQGKARYGSQRLKDSMGKKNQKPIVHYDYLYLQPHSGTDTPV